MLGTLSSSVCTATDDWGGACVFKMAAPRVVGGELQDPPGGCFRADGRLDGIGSDGLDTHSRGSCLLSRVMLMDSA